MEVLTDYSMATLKCLKLCKQTGNVWIRGGFLTRLTVCVITSHIQILQPCGFINHLCLPWSSIKNDMFSWEKMCLYLSYIQTTKLWRALSIHAVGLSPSPASSNELVRTDKTWKFILTNGELDAVSRCSCFSKPCDLGKSSQIMAAGPHISHPGDFLIHC